MTNRCQLYYITDRTQFRGDEHERRRALLEKITEAAHSRVDYIQLREKDLSARDLEALAKEAVAALRSLTPRTGDREKITSRRTRLLINSRTDVSLASHADGVHLRTDDVTPTDARKLVALSGHRPPTTGHFFIAASCHSIEDVFRAQSDAADFAVFAPVFGKHQSPGTKPAGLATLQEACRAQIPVLALGGVTLDNAESCLRAGAAGIAAIRLFQQNKIEDVVRALHAL
ncbi:MAG: thiamine phosphate synthase [Terriglobales bacterium]|jgi:thiamine-phosphate pyrophosphorylase